ncbi:glycosyl hydrolase [Pseudokineococcus marinus]|uniref:GH26 domain-containing protein n=1 Tax=Pseudokineococcus marinus TaxID=351215 RepID=A0A849BKQ8_9ACTN|nr:glycosyl hydrolase [Pseudokineococcus marinus]NNH21677.1 hypothetical protein [Pseudokineococcus marinus]
MRLTTESETSRRGPVRGLLERFGVLAATAALAATTLVAAGAPAAQAQEPAKMFGSSGSTRTLIEQNEKTAGTAVRGARVFRSWDSTLFGRDQTWARDTGHTMFLSVKSSRSNGTKVRWADVANAKPGSTLYRDMQRQAAQIKAFGSKVYIGYHHEPEATPGHGTPAEFAAAWRKLVSVYRAEGVRNAEYVWVMTAWGFLRKDDRRAELFYPGDSYVDGIAADAYNWYRCRSSTGKWTSLRSVIEGQRKFGLKHPGKDLMLWEFGSVEDPAQPGRKAQWLRDARSMLKEPAYSQYKVVLTWEGRNYDNGNCHFDYQTSSTARSAWVEFTRDAAFSARSLA